MLSDSQYLREKLSSIFDPVERNRIEKQIALLDDAVVVYTLTLPSR